mgnify:CR=1 FL=1
MSSLLRVEHVTISYNGKPISAEKVDDLTLNITLQEPNSAFETEFGRLQPLPKHVFKGTNVSEQTEAATKGIGNGMYINFHIKHKRLTGA